MDQAKENSREVLQGAIDAGIKLLEDFFVESVRNLRYKRNALSPVSSLPPEIFVAIFSILCPDGKPGHNIARIHLSHVCHQWREIALDHSLLWRHVDFTTLSLAGAVEILTRAKSAPLYLEAKISSERWDYLQFNTFRKELQAWAPRIRRLAITAECVEIRKTLRALESPAPTLDWFSLSSADQEDVSIPDTLFNGSAPKLSWLRLRYCSISWKWPLFKSLKYLQILVPGSRPTLAVWLDALAEMSELKTLTLNRAIPKPSPFPFDIERTVTLPFLTHINILDHLEVCVLALAHLDLPTLTHLSLEAFCDSFPKRDDVQKLLPHVARYMYGTQHTQPLQSMLIRNTLKYIDILTWPVPDIDVEVQNLNSPIVLSAKLPTRLALSFIGRNTFDPYDSHYYSHLELLGWLITGLPLDDVVTLSAEDLCDRTHRLAPKDIPAKQFWFHISPKFTQLWRVSLSSPTVGAFIEMLLEDNEGRERPLLPSLTELIFIKVPDYYLAYLPLIDALMKRVELGVPLEVLDFRMSFDGRIQDKYIAQFQCFNEVVVDVLGLESDEAKIT